MVGDWVKINFAGGWCIVWSTIGFGEFDIFLWRKMENGLKLVVSFMEIRSCCVGLIEEKTIEQKR